LLLSSSLQFSRFSKLGKGFGEEEDTKGKGYIPSFDFVTLEFRENQREQREPPKRVKVGQEESIQVFWRGRETKETRTPQKGSK
jgi:hypothetical protein